MSDPTSAAKNYKRKDKTEQKLSLYAKNHGLSLITGHTHRPRLNPGDLSYINTGSCVHPRCITCIEIACGKMTLVKWALSTRADGGLYVARSALMECRPGDASFSFKDFS